MERRYEHGQLILPAVILVAIGTVATADIVGNSDKPKVPNIAHHSMPYEVGAPNSIGVEGGVEAPPSLSRVLRPHTTLTPSGVLETGGVAAP